MGFSMPKGAAADPESGEHTPPPSVRSPTATIAAHREKQRNARQRGGQQGQGTDREAARTAREKLEKELDAEIDKILTEKQKAELKALGGKPFKFEN